MGLFEKIKLNMARNGKISLKDCDVKYGFDENFVEACIQGRGVEEFQYASEWLRTDANFILKMIEKYPEIIEHCSEEIYDRYNDEKGLLIEKEMDKFFFQVLCCKKNLKVYRFLDNESAKRYMEAVKEEKVVSGEYHGEKKFLAFQNSEFAIDRLNNIRYDIVKLKNYVRFDW